MGFDKQAYQREWMRKRRQEILEQLGGKCVICGSKQELEMDHIDPETKSLPVTQVISLSASNPIRVAELAKCQLLCKMHHLEKTLATAKVHGIYGYRKGCRCNVCTHAKDAEKKRYLTRKKERIDV